MNFKLLLIAATLLVSTRSAQNQSELFTTTNNGTSEQQNVTSEFTIDVNDSITVDYMMDDSSWNFANLSFDDVYYNENFDSMVGNSFGLTIMNQLRTPDGASALEMRYLNESFSDQFKNESNVLVKSFAARNLIKIDDSIHWPIKKEAVVEGHVILGGLMMVHEREDNMTCGPIMPQGGIQALETMLFTLDKINEMKLLNDITIGAHILDDCDKDTYGLEMAVDFIKGELSWDDSAVAFLPHILII
jgi:hypothetical protein